MASAVRVARRTVSISVQEKRAVRPRTRATTQADSISIAKEVEENFEDESDLTPLEDEDDIPRKRSPAPRKRTKRKSTTLHDSHSEDEEFPATESRAVTRSRKRTDSRVADNADTEVMIVPEQPPKKKKRGRAPKPEPVYIIPDVEKKVTTFKGRLGYACLNTILRNKKPASEAVFCSRTCRIQSIKKNGVDWVKDLGRQNVEDLLEIIEWNEQNNIRFMRISSEMFPFASHEIYGYTLDYCAPLMAQAGALARQYGHRLTTHPGQFTQLGSPREAVVRSSIRELEYHAEMLDRMGIDQDGVMIIHGGGVYGDKEAALARLKKVIQDNLPAHVRARLVLENDELCYNAADLLPMCRELNVPLVFDYHHDSLNPSPGLPPSAIIAQANEIFRRRGIKPKQHHSEPRNGAVSIMEMRAHSDRCQSLPEALPDDMDLMIEAKDKEQAVLHLYRIYDLQPVLHESLRPPAEQETKETKGRKSSRKTRSQKVEDDEALQTGIGIEGDQSDDCATLVDVPLPDPALTAGTPTLSRNQGGLEQANEPAPGDGPPQLKPSRKSTRLKGNTRKAQLD